MWTAPSTNMVGLLGIVVVVLFGYSVCGPYRMNVSWEPVISFGLHARPQPPRSFQHIRFEFPQATA